MTTARIVRDCLRLLGRRDRWVLGLATLAQMVSSLLDLVGVALVGIVSVMSVSLISGGSLPASVQQIVDRTGFLDMDDVTLVLTLSAVAGCALVLKSTLSALLARWTFKFLARRQAELSVRLTAGLLSRPLAALQERASQDVAFTLTAGTLAVTVGILGGASAAIADVALLVVMGAGLAFVDPVVMVFTVAFFSLLAFTLQRSLSGRAKRLGHQATDLEISTYMTIQEAIESYREVTVLDRRGLYVDRMKSMQYEVARIGADSQFMNLIPRYAFDTALVVGALLLAGSQLYAKTPTAAVGVISVFIVAASRVMPAIQRLQVSALYIRRAEAPAKKVFELQTSMSTMDTPIMRNTDLAEIRAHLKSGYPDFSPSILVEELSYSHPGARHPAVHGISFSAKPGESVAIVGPTGAGKSSLADLVLGIAEPDAGTVRLGGLRPGEAVARWPGGIAYVPQEVALVGGSVRENVALGIPALAIDDDRVWEALERAHLADFLRTKREGIDTVIGEDGMWLSGGQRQRLGVARALYTRPRLLVMDEATSALDADTEASIGTTIRDLEGDVTTVTIAHRLATIRHCDLVLYLDHGEVAARGTFDEVRAQSPALDHQARLLGL